MISVFPDPQDVWREFLDMVSTGHMCTEKIRPLHQAISKESLYEIVRRLNAIIPVTRWPANPAVRLNDDHLIYLVTLNLEGESSSFVFRFELNEDGWFFRHVETILIPLDSIPPLPASSFPDLSEQKKAWIRAELRATEDVRLFNYLKWERGRDFALNWFKDGEGYFLAARSWVPLLPEHEAFILYMCWEQSVLQGNPVTLEHLNERQATVRLRPVFLHLYDCASHLKQQISEEDYRAIFETVWKDRALAAGWSLEIEYKMPYCVLRFSRQPQTSARRS